MNEIYIFGAQPKRVEWREPSQQRGQAMPYFTLDEASQLREQASRACAMAEFLQDPGARETVLRAAEMLERLAIEVEARTER